MAAKPVPQADVEAFLLREAF